MLYPLDLNGGDLCSEAIPFLCFVVLQISVETFG